MALNSNGCPDNILWLRTFTIAFSAKKTAIILIIYCHSTHAGTRDSRNSLITIFTSLETWTRLPVRYMMDLKCAKCT